MHADNLRRWASEELEERRKGMRSLDPAAIAGHFERARVLRAKARAVSLAPVATPAGTKGAWSQP